MLSDLTHRFATFVTTHNRLVILAMLVLTAGVAFGMTLDQGDVDQDLDDAIGDTDEYQAAEYMEERYGDDETGENVSYADVYVLPEDGSALDRENLLAGIEYQQTVLEDETVADALFADGTDAVDGVPNRVAVALIEDPSADLDAQYDAIESASDEELEAAIGVALGDEEAAFFLPASSEAGGSMTDASDTGSSVTGATDVDAYRMTIAFEESDEQVMTGVDFDVQQALFDEATAAESPQVYAPGDPVWAELNQTLLGEVAWLIVPAVLVLLLIILGFAYRDLTDVLLGFTGTVVALVWTAGLMGWMGLLNEITAIIVLVLVAALSIDFGFHIFMRYRERRGPDDGIRHALRRSTGAVAVAFILVTITAAIGFLSNQFSPVPLIRDLGVAITLGVVASLVIFTTLVPAMKVSADGLWERFGFDRRKMPLGKGPHLSRVLGTGALLARRAPVAVIVVALVAAAGGGLAFTELDREAWEAFDPDDVPDWQTQLPGPMAIESHEDDLVQQMEYVNQQFQGDQEDLVGGGMGYTTMLVQGADGEAIAGEVTNDEAMGSDATDDATQGTDDATAETGIATPETMAAIATGHDAAADADRDIVLEQGGEVRTISVLTVMESVAAENESFAATLAAADTTGDGVPDRDVEAVLDELFAAAPEEAAAVVERTDDGTYASTLVQVPAQQEAGSDRAAVMSAIADAIDAESDDDVTAVGTGKLNDAEMAQITDGIVVTLLVALAGVLLALAFVYRVVHDSLLLGAVTVVPIGLALGLVFGGMYLAGQPLTMTTALLVGITIGLGIDYNIHVSDRFAQELQRGRDVTTALREAVTGTGGALLGSAVTSGGAFSLLILVPVPDITSFGLITALALGFSFLLSVFVLPSLLWLWATNVRFAGAMDRSSGAVPSD